MADSMFSLISYPGNFVMSLNFFSPHTRTLGLSPNSTSTAPSRPALPPTSRQAQRPVDEVGSCLEVDAHVKGWRVMGLDTQVADAQPLVGLVCASPPAV